MVLYFANKFAYGVSTMSCALPSVGINKTYNILPKLSIIIVKLKLILFF